MQTLKEVRVEFDFILHSWKGTLDNRESAVLSLVFGVILITINIISLSTSTPKSSSMSTKIFCQNPKVKTPIFHVHKKNKEDTLNKMSFVFKQEKKGKKGWTHNKVIKTRPQSCAGHHHQFLPCGKILSFLGILLFPKYSFEKVTNRTRLQQNF